MHVQRQYLPPSLIQRDIVIDEYLKKAHKAVITGFLRGNMCCGGQEENHTIMDVAFDRC
ncbi:hypothetical protein [Geopsychrobacter electrodiphilus]|uniref:hypothetical protein n=1 Tax=Geopsychrobacter electrodiphilus TaxID=225196 RepID=UPI0012EB290E|nr:hypothetical protein [Geopsychrobacter electrodiphilus]